MIGKCSLRGTNIHSAEQSNALYKIKLNLAVITRQKTDCIDHADLSCFMSKYFLPDT